MELRHVRYFIAVAESLSFTKGADKLRITQPSLTRQIKDLESELGVSLFDRSNRKIKLTREGELFLSGAKRLLGVSAEVIESVQSLKEKRVPAINIGYLPTPFHRALPTSLARFEAELPDVAINIFGMSAVEQLEALQHRKLDIGFIGLVDSTGTTSDDLEFRVVDSDAATVMVAATHPLAKSKKVRMEDLQNELFAILAEEYCPGYRRWFETNRETSRFAGHKKLVVTNEDELLAAIKEQGAIAIAAFQGQEPRNGIAVLRSIDPVLQVPSRVAWRRDNNSTALRSYLSILARKAAEV